MAAQTIKKPVDEEWLELIRQAKHLGLSIDEIKAFIERGRG
ncbi:anti-repressor SinI family protein [Halobacillus mangrovi]|uniref:Sin domain-containing protein n=1 Tax=Halobacillus mangrovi TaxID=402384 RepID=A0A1W5ZSC5_9BACI|nr:anti-repressor SinI family protein [Halobacillus mangrovi]ARI76183.1 hypothetical protein HM131_04735 [Halobacillus mangrovi]